LLGAVFRRCASAPLRRPAALDLAEAVGGQQQKLRRHATLDLAEDFLREDRQLWNKRPESASRRTAGELRDILQRATNAGKPPTPGFGYRATVAPAAVKAHERPTSAAASFLRSDSVLSNAPTLQPTSPYSRPSRQASVSSFAPLLVLTRTRSAASLSTVSDAPGSSCASNGALPVNLEAQRQARQSMFSLKNTLREEKAMSGIPLGFWVTMLGFPCPRLGQQPQTRGAHSQPAVAEFFASVEVPVGEANDTKTAASVQQVLRIFGHFRRLQQMDDGAIQRSTEPVDGCASDDSDGVVWDDVGSAALPPVDELAPVSWETMLFWIEQEKNCGLDASYMSLCASLISALKIWRRQRASPEQQRQGVSLTMLLQWICGDKASDLALSVMLSWIGFAEMQKLRQETPRLIDADDRKQLTRIFERGFAKGRPRITTEDLAGGKYPDVYTKRLTLVDATVAEAVFGNKEVDLPAFLEHMCDSDARGHENVTKVRLPDGNRLAYCNRQALDFKGWILQDAPDHEKEQRRLVDALEAEVLKCRRSFRNLNAQAVNAVAQPKALHRPSSAASCGQQRRATVAPLGAPLGRATGPATVASIRPG
ncbi:unnamed protein product, partial [Polarella glacialis]